MISSHQLLGHVPRSQSLATKSLIHTSLCGKMDAFILPDWLLEKRSGGLTAGMAQGSEEAVSFPLVPVIETCGALFFPSSVQKPGG